MTGAAPSRSSTRANRHRGEIEAVIDGQRHILVLTLGSLAELETAFDVADLMALAARFEAGRISSSDAMVILATALRGGGLDVSPQDVGRMRPEGGAGGWVAILSDLLSATFSQPSDNGKAEAGDKPPENPPARNR